MYGINGKQQLHLLLPLNEQHSPKTIPEYKTEYSSLN